MSKLRLFSVLSVVILIACASFTIVSNFVQYNEFWGMLSIILSNPFVSGILYTIGLIFVVFDFQITASKRHIKKDFRCNEILDDSYEEVLHYKKIIASLKNEDESKAFIIEHQAELFVINLALTYPNNEILFDSLKSSFFFNLNFKLLGILNNIQNRLPNLTTKNSRVLDFINNTAKKPDFTDSEAKTYMIDLRFMVIYWIDLFEYLKYDNLYSHTLVKIYKENYPNDSYKDLKVIQEHLKQIEKSYGKMIKKEIKKAKKRAK